MVAGAGGPASCGVSSATKPRGGNTRSYSRDLLLVVSAVSLLPTRFAVARADPRRKLVHYTLDPIVECGDGSPAGFYTNAYTTSDIANENHIINFMGGGGCASAVACEAMQDQQPYMLSSKFEPTAIEGATILSNERGENPAMAGFTKWNVHYCSQDLWLGNGGVNLDLVRSGSLHVKGILNHWLNGVLEANAEIDTLVVAGTSAGTMAILNHFDQIQEVAKEAGVKSLRLLLDSSLYPDRIDTNFTPLINAAVDPKEHPLCFEEEANKLQHETLSKLPCCFSTHCMLRHSESLTNWARGDDTSETQMLLVDAAYDSLQAFIDLSSDDSPINALPSGGLGSLDGVASTTLNIAEYAGRRKARVVETMYGGERQLGPNVIWVMTSAPGHNALIPSVELFTRLCKSGKLAEESTCKGERDCVFSEYPGGVVQECNSTGSGLKLPLSNGLHMTMWTTTDTWKLLTVGGQSVQDVISEFVAPTTATDSTNVVLGSSSLLIDMCPGPNCVPADSAVGNPAQTLIEVEEISAPIATWLRAIVSAVVALVPSAYLLTICCMRMKMGNVNKHPVPGKMAKAKSADIYFRGLDVFSGTGEQILDNVSIDLRSSTLSCLLGKSGSGKSCLLGVLSRQLRSNLKVQYVDGTDLSQILCTFMRQQDLGMEHMTPNDYLRTTAKVYGTDEERLNFILTLARPFFPIREDEQGNIVLDPFNNAPINQLSGGQRRMISIATALFQPSSLLLLDEPLSGVDSASSEKIVELLKAIAKNNAMTVLMTLHQPSDDILSKMDKVMILGGGRVVFDGEFEDTPRLQTKSTADVVHNIISRGTVTGVRQSSLEMFKISQSVQSAIGDDKEDAGDDDEEDVDESKRCMIRLWQVKPLLERLHLECPPNKQDILVLPICYLAISLWGIFDAGNPLQGFLVTAALTYIPSVLFQTRLIMNWGILRCHAWDLEDKRISPLAYQISSGIQMVYVPILSIIVSFSIAYGVFGWSFASFWDVVLFAIMLTVTALQFGKMLCSALGTYQAVAGLYSVYTYLGLVVSGFFVNPAKIPSYLRWLMYFSLSFWGISGAELTQLEYVPIGDEECLTIISCIVLNRNFIAQATGFTAVTTAHLSMVALFTAVILLSLIEYCFLLRKVQQRGNFEKVKPPGNARASSILVERVRSSGEVLLVLEAVERGSLSTLEDAQTLIEEYHKICGTTISQEEGDANMETLEEAEKEGKLTDSMFAHFDEQMVDAEKV